MEILSVRYRTFMVGPGVDATMCEMEIYDGRRSWFVSVTVCVGEHFLATRCSPYDDMFAEKDDEQSDLGVLRDCEGREKACADRRYGKAFRKLCAVLDQIKELNADE